MAETFTPQETELERAPLPASAPYSRTELAVIAEMRRAARTCRVCSFVVTVDPGGVTIRTCGVPIRVRN